MPEQPVMTSIDELVRYVREHGETDALTLAAALKVSTKIIEDWSTILEKANVVKIIYKMGKMYVSPAEARTAEAAKMTTKILEDRRSEIEIDLATQVAALNKVNERIGEYKTIITGAEKIFKTNAGEIKEALDRINKLEHEVQANYNKLKERKEFVDKLGTDLDKEINAINTKASEVTKVDLSSDNAKKIIDDVRSKIRASEDATNTLLHNYDKAVNEQRKRLVAMIDSIKSEDAALKDAAAASERQLDRYAHSMESYEREANQMKRKLESERVRLLDEIERSKQNVDRLTQAADTEVKKFETVMGAVKSKFGPFVNLDQQMGDIKGEIASIEKERDDLMKDIAALGAAVKDISSERAGRIGEQAERTEKTIKSVSDINKKTTEVKKKADDVKKKIDDLGKGK